MEIIELLEEENIEYWTDGRNVTDGWININCPYCPENRGRPDPSNHCGISPSGFFNCWICGEKGRVSKLIYKLTGRKEKIDIEPHEKEKKRAKEFKFPPGITNKFAKRHIDFLISREFNPNYLIYKYKLLAGHTTGKYKWRIIAPYFHSGEIVTFVARSISKKDYKNCPEEKSILTTKETFYNIDEIKEGKAIIVEGITDVWRIGENCIATSGTKTTKKQLDVLNQKNLKYVIVLFDSDATDRGEKLANQLCSIIRNVDLITLPKGDPADLKNEDVKKIKKILDCY